MKFGRGRKTTTQKEKNQMKADIREEKEAAYELCQKDVRKEAKENFRRPAFAYTNFCKDPFYRR